MADGPDTHFDVYTLVMRILRNDWAHPQNRA